MEVEGNLFWIDRKRRIDCGSWVWPAESSEIVGSPNEYTFYVLYATAQQFFTSVTVTFGCDYLP